MHDFYNRTIFPFEDVATKCSLSTNIENEYNFRYYQFKTDNNKELTASYVDNTFKFNLVRNTFRENVKSVIIICSKDNSNILSYTLSKLHQYNTFEEHDVLLVDDRSKTQDILDLSIKYNLSYLRIDNDIDIFNYSLLNNIAAAYADAFNKELLIFHNNDMWPSSPETLKNIINKHIKYNSNISGCRLVYPTKQEYEDIGKPTHLLNDKLDQLYDTIQHGGIFFIPRESFVFKRSKNSPIQLWAPAHLYRFYNKDYFMACEDSTCYSVTGALHIINTSDFISLDGLNICLATAFQDIDLCIKALAKDMKVYYIGSEYMYHAESITNAKEDLTNKPEFIYDHIVWDMLWAHPLPYLLGHNANNQQYV